MEKQIFKLMLKGVFMTQETKRTSHSYWNRRMKEYNHAISKGKK